MQNFMCCLLVVLTGIAGFTSKIYARSTEKTLYAFNGKAGGGGPSALISDSQGNLYGMAQDGGNSSICNGFGCGVVFELSPTVTGKWTETVLHKFAGGADGADPIGGLIFDAAGNLYGMTGRGGANNWGLVFELSPGVGGIWNETILYTFSGAADGGEPQGELIFDSVGNLYGTTVFGGDLTCGAMFFAGCGTVFRLAPLIDGSWEQSVLYTFHGREGANPTAGLVIDGGGNLFGTTYEGGTSKLCPVGCGVVFKLAPATDDSWNYSVLHIFSGGSDGALPNAVLTLDASGNIYGTANAGGNSACPSLGCGLVFEFSPVAGGRWKETVIHSFNNGTDGSFILTGLALDPAGNLYGTTYIGGRISGSCPQGCGRVYELSPASDGKWKETELYGFNDGADGASPNNRLLRNASGQLFGSAMGGAPNATEVFEITP